MEIYNYNVLLNFFRLLRNFVFNSIKEKTIERAKKVHLQKKYKKLVKIV